MPVATNIKPIQGMLKRGIVVDLASAIGLGMSVGYLYWYGYHIPAVRHRDRFYAKIEDERMRGVGTDPEIQTPGM